MLVYRMLLWGLAIVFISLPAQEAAGTQVKWFRSLEEALREANEAEKDLLIVFTGHGWCINCEKLDREVLQREKFSRAASATFVLVELDFNFGNTSDERARESQFEALKKKYLAPAVPTVVLADNRGVPYAIWTGYQPGLGVDEALRMLTVARAAKARRDLHFAEANASTGEARITALDQGIQAVAELLGSVEERGDDPVLVFYSQQIETILKSEVVGASAIRDRYRARQQRLKELRALDPIYLGLKPFDEAKDYVGAAEYIVQRLRMIKDPRQRWQLELSRQVYLEWAGQHEVALANAQRLLKMPELTAKDREYLLNRESYNLFNLDRFDEAVSQCDRRIAEAKDADQRLRQLAWKAQLILNRGRPQSEIEAWREYRRATVQHNDEWLAATAMLSRLLDLSGEDREAQSLLDELLSQQRSPGWLLLSADIHAQLGEAAQALALLAEADNALVSLRQSNRKSERDAAAVLEKQMISIRTKLTALRRD